jgi:hypothetical protein
MNIIEAKNVCKQYNSRSEQTTVLNCFNMTVERGTMLEQPQTNAKLTLNYFQLCIDGKLGMRQNNAHFESRWGAVG